MAVGELGALISSLEWLPVAAILTDLRAHTFVAVNDGAATLFGSPVRDLVGSDVLPRIDPGIEKQCVRDTRSWPTRSSTATRLGAGS